MYPAAPNYNSPATRSAWWLEHLPSGINVVSTTGNTFIKRLQSSLTDYYSTLGSDTPSDFAYVDGRADVPSTNFDWHRIGDDGRWGPVVNAALWRWLANQRVTSPQTPDVQHAIQYHLDQIERVIIERRVNFEALRIAIWAARHRTMGIAQAFSTIDPATPATLAQIVPPPYLAAPPAPTDPNETGVFHTDLGDVGSEPGNISTQPGPSPLLVGGIVLGILALGFLWQRGR